MNKHTLFTLLAVMLCWSSFAHAIEKATGSYFKTIAIPFEHTLLRAIPHRNKALFKPEDVVISEGKAYLVRPHARALVHALKKQGYKIVLLSLLPKGSDALAKLVTINKKGDQTLSQIASIVPVGADEPWDTKALGLDAATLYLVFDQLKIDKEAKTLNTGPTFYAYPTYEKLKENKPAEPNEFFPDTEEKWYLEYNSLARVYTHLSLVLKGGLPEAMRAIQSVEKGDPKQQTLEGARELEYVLEPYLFKFIKSPDGSKYLGCERTENRTKAKNMVPLIECAEQDNKVFFGYKNLRKSSCSIFDEENIEIGAVDVRKCNEFVVIRHPKTNTMHKLRVIEGMESMSEAEFIRRILESPTDANPYRLYDPTDVLAKKDHLNYLECYRATGNINLQAFDASGNLHESCKLDTLYSWGTEAKLNVLISQMGQVNPWKTIQTIYTSRGPFSTFGYGPVAIRIKLKKNVVFKRTSSYTRCDHATSPEAQTTVYVRNGDQYRDWTICNTGVIHSWSFFNREHYDEIVKDYLRHQELLQSGTSIAGYIEQYSSYQQARTVFGGSIDGHSFGEEKLIQNLQLFIRKIENGSEKIYYNPDLPASEKNREAHFRTSYPTYFNER